MSWPTTTVTKKLGILFPIIQASMAGGATTPELVAAISNAGGLGSLAVGYMGADDIRKAISRVRELTNNPFAVNFFIPEKHDATVIQINEACRVLEVCAHELNIKIAPVSPPYAPSFQEQINIIFEENVPILSFTFGVLDPHWIAKFKNIGTVLMGTATHLEEALLLEKNGIDFIVAQGSEAGGHRGTFIGEAENALIPLSDLLLQFVEQIKIPVIAAGGIMNGKDIVSALKLNAQAVQMGTAFLSCVESGVHARYKQVLLATEQGSTALTRAFSGKLARGIKNKFMTRMQFHENTILDYPVQNALTRTMRKTAERQENIDFMSMWAGESAYLSRRGSVSELMKQLILEVRTFLSDPNT